MNIKDLTTALPYLFEAQTTAFLWGRAGIGKSSIVKQYAQSKGYHFFPLYLGTQSDLGDVLGLAEFVDNGDGSKSTNFATPKWLNDAIRYCEQNPDSGAIIFLDEFNRARRDVLNGMFSLALDKTFHTIKLPKNCHIIAAGNPPTDEYFVTDVNDTALMSRFVHIKLEPSFEEFMEYAKGNSFEPTILSFLKEQPSFLEDKHSNFDLQVKVDRRSYERLNRLFKLGVPNNILSQLMHGIIGLERSVAYELHLKNVDKPLTGAEVLNGSGLNKVKTWSNPENIASSLLGITGDNLRDYIVQRETDKQPFTKDEEAALMEYFTTIPRDIMVMTIKKIIKLEHSIFKDFYSKPKYRDILIKMTKEAKGAS